MGGHDIEHIAHHRSDERDDHDGQNDAGSQHADAHGRAGKERADKGQRADMVVDPRLDVVGEQRRKNEQSPHAVDDAGDAGQQFDRDAQRAAQPARREFGQKDGDAETDRDRDQQRDARSDQGADDGNQRRRICR